MRSPGNPNQRNSNLATGLPKRHLLLPRRILPGTISYNILLRGDENLRERQMVGKRTTLWVILSSKYSSSWNWNFLFKYFISEIFRSNATNRRNWKHVIFSPVSNRCVNKFNNIVQLCFTLTRIIGILAAVFVVCVVFFLVCLSKNTRPEPRQETTNASGQSCEPVRV